MEEPDETEDLEDSDEDSEDLCDLDGSGELEREDNGLGCSECDGGGGGLGGDDSESLEPSEDEFVRGGDGGKGILCGSKAAGCSGLDRIKSPD